MAAENAGSGPGIEPVLEVMAFTEDTTVVLTRLPDGKLRATSKSWDEAKVVLPDQVLEVRMVGQRIRIARKVKHHDEGDRPAIAPVAVIEGEITEFLGA